MLNVFKSRSWTVVVMVLLSCTQVFAQGTEAQPGTVLVKPGRQVVAEKGDGVYSLLRKNGLDPARYRKAFIQLNTERMDGQGRLILGDTYILPAVPSPGQKELHLRNGQAYGHSSKGKATVDSLNRGHPGSTASAVQGASGKSRKNLPKPKTPSLKPITNNVKTVDYPIFGDKYARVEITDNRLKGAVYYLISGHGGPDPGAVEKYQGKEISEDEYAYDVTLRLARKLISHGAVVYLIVRDPDDGIRDAKVLVMDTDENNHPGEKISGNQRLRLRQRSAAVNRLYHKNKGTYQRLVVLHLDSRSKGENIDVFFYHHHRSKKGKKLATHLQETFREKYARHQPNREYHGTVSDRSSLYVIKNTLPATVFIELGNIRNEQDKRRFLISDNRKALAKWIGEGIIKDYNTP